jgi:hypothetical protein
MGGEISSPQGRDDETLLPPLPLPESSMTRWMEPVAEPMVPVPEVDTMRAAERPPSL